MAVCAVRSAGSRAAAHTIATACVHRQRHRIASRLRSSSCSHVTAAHSVYDVVETVPSTVDSVGESVAKPSPNLACTRATASQCELHPTIDILPLVWDSEIDTLAQSFMRSPASADAPRVWPATRRGSHVQASLLLRERHSASPASPPRTPVGTGTRVSFFFPNDHAGREHPRAGKRGMRAGFYCRAVLISRFNH